MKAGVLPKKQVGDQDGGYYAGKVGDEAGGDSIARSFYAHGAEIQRDDIKCGIGRAVKNTTQPPCKAVGAKGLHGIDHHCFRP